MLKEAVTVVDRVKADAGEMGADRRIPAKTETAEEFDFESRWTPVAFTQAMSDGEGEA